MRKALLGMVAVGCLLLSGDVSAYRTEKPQPFSRWDCPSFTRLNNFLSEIWNITNGRYNLDSITSNPNGVRPGTRGEMVYAFFSNDEYFCVNSSDPSPGTSWTCVNITTFPTLCGGGINGAILYDDNGACGEDEGLTFTESTNLVNINEATADGDSLLLLLQNDNAHDGDASESVSLQFGFATETDNGRIRLTKTQPYNTAANSDASLQFYADYNGTLTEGIRIQPRSADLATVINPGATSLTGAISGTLTVNGNTNIGSGVVTNVGAPTDGLLVEGPVAEGPGWSGVSRPSNTGFHAFSTTASNVGLSGYGSAIVDGPATISLGWGDADEINALVNITVEQSTTAATRPNSNQLFLVFSHATSTAALGQDAPEQIQFRQQNRLGLTNENTFFRVRSLSSESQGIASGITLANYRHILFEAPTINGVAGGAAETITSASTVYIDEAPSGSNISFTNGPYALWVDDGLSRFDGGITIASGIIIGGSTGNVDSGVWTPTTNNIQNLASSSAAEGQYIRVKNTVTGSILLTVDPTLASTTTELELDLPVASNFGATSDAAGACGGSDVVSEVAAIRADAASDELEVIWVTTSLASHEISCSFSYQIL